MRQQAEHPGLYVGLGQAEVVFMGLPNMVTEVKLAMYQTVHSVSTQTCPDMEPTVCALLGRPGVKAHLADILRTQRLTIAWEVTDGLLVLSGPTDKDVTVGIQTLKKEVLVNKMSLSQEDRKVQLGSNGDDCLIACNHIQTISDTSFMVSGSESS